jgi:2-polyprenyl-3-methyl-5-hydroxy-6-metoxy-1,4-benzoquinol methylase
LVHNQYLDEAFLQAHAPFDVVMSSDVLEHIPNPSALLDLMAHAVSPDGIVLISVPNVAHWTVRLNLLRGRFDYAPFGIMDVTHLRWFTAKSISALVRQCGFTLIEMRHTAGFTLPVYGNRYFRRLPKGPLVWTITQMTKLFPRLFGVQHVLVLKPTAEGADFRPTPNH